MAPDQEDLIILAMQVARRSEACRGTIKQHRQPPLGLSGAKPRAGLFAPGSGREAGV
jgi:hypothetical protein